ncbi:FKBP-type peptidyl-prolyl cis-trans isomerase [Parabacteroides pacaensis]|uniref:FKBP-type peptidyl-prolyl cis-trans isomerase n=1 Tax=Parabacteroides pacaensis TaxID=2086575 RepID=UPI000D0E86CA|nr:FKBP-type peptidyl-prolyl cis-trans isomerase [Parabacteroides pacaensis]
MKKILNIALWMICTLTLFACSDDDDEIVIDQVWKAENEEFINNLRKDGKYKHIIAPSQQDTIFYEVLEEGTGEQPLATATVEVFYKGSLINEKIFSSTRGFDTAEEDDDVSENWVLLSYSATYPTQYSGMVEGCAVALQNMKVGARWRIYVPWSLGYGAAGSSVYKVAIPGCSTLIYEVKLLNIVTQTSKAK